MSTQTPMEREVATLIVTALNLEIAVGDIAPEDALFYEGLGLDSIDALELALEISRSYGFELRAEDEDNQRNGRDGSNDSQLDQRPEGEMELAHGTASLVTCLANSHPA